MRISSEYTLCTEVTTVLFSEIYGSYFNVVAAVLSEASAGCLTDRRMTELIQAKAFAESSLSIPAAPKRKHGLFWTRN